MFPDSIGGEPLTVQSMTGDQMSISGDDPEMTRRIEELLAANGLVSDIAIGFVGDPWPARTAISLSGSGRIGVQWS